MLINEKLREGTKMKKEIKKSILLQKAESHTLKEITAEVNTNQSIINELTNRIDPLLKMRQDHYTIRNHWLRVKEKKLNITKG